MNPMLVLQPNSMGSQFSNLGTDTQQANPAAATDEKQDANPVMTGLRRAKSREFGRPMEEVGF
jgi:hypothetical protein